MAQTIDTLYGSNFHLTLSDSFSSAFALLLIIFKLIFLPCLLVLQHVRNFLSTCERFFLSPSTRLFHASLTSLTHSSNLFLCCVSKNWLLCEIFHPRVVDVEGREFLFLCLCTSGWLRKKQGRSFENLHKTLTVKAAITFVSFLLYDVENYLNHPFGNLEGGENKLCHMNL